MSDLIRRLREEPKSRERLNGLSSAATVAWHDTCLEAADRIESDAAQIESLQRENDELREHVKEAEAGAGEANELVKIIGRRQFITPEMRERLLRSLRWKNADKPSWGEAVYMRDSINMVLNTGGEG